MQVEVYTDEYYRNLPVDSGRIATLVSQLELDPTDIVCEIGCAAGHFLVAIANQIKYGIGIDTAEAAIQAALQLKEARGLSNIDFMAVSAEEHSKSSHLVGEFSHVFMMDVTEHVDDEVLRGIFCAARDLLAGDGELVIHTPNRGYWLELLKDRGILPQYKGHIAVRHYHQYVGLLEEAGFAVKKNKGLPHYRQPLRMVDMLLMRVPLIGRLFVSRLFISARQVNGQQ